MKKLLVISDTHGDVQRLRAVLKKERDADALFFLGDGADDLDAVQGDFKGLVYRVRGNCDHCSNDPLEGMVAFERVLLFYTHGHTYNVKTGYAALMQAAQNRGADLTLFGHTHFAVYRKVEHSGGLLNPGSLRSTGHYGVVYCTDGDFLCEIREVP